MIIKPFRGDYAFLSNMWECPVYYNNVDFPSSEHAYQAAKYNDMAIRLRIAALPTPSKAKSFWREHPELVDHKRMASFTRSKTSIMAEILADKFTRNSNLKQLLLETIPHQLVEEGWWHDNFWGTCTCGNKDGRHPQCLRPGRNELGQILMRLRTNIKRGWHEPKQSEIRWDW